MHQLCPSVRINQSDPESCFFSLTGRSSVSEVFSEVANVSHESFEALKYLTAFHKLIGDESTRFVLLSQVKSCSITVTDIRGKKPLCCSVSVTLDDLFVSHPVTVAYGWQHGYDAQQLMSPSSGRLGQEKTPCFLLSMKQYLIVCHFTFCIWYIFINQESAPLERYSKMWYIDYFKRHFVTSLSSHSHCLN